MRFKSNKRAFIVAALIITLCLVYLTGATLALLTNNPEDGTIGIVTTSGDVSIDIVDTEGNTLEGKALAFITLSGEDEPTFEPGATFHTQGFQIKNKGDIPVNYTFSVSKDARIDMNEFNQAFDVWLVRAADVNDSSAEQLQKFKGRLDVGGVSDVYYLVVKMKEEAGNEFQGKSYDGIGITVYAVQGNVEIKE